MALLIVGFGEVKPNLLVCGGGRKVEELDLWLDMANSINNDRYIMQMHHVMNPQTSMWIFSPRGPLKIS